MVNRGIISAIGQVLTGRDPRSLVVALEGLNFILKCGQEHLVNGENPFVAKAEECGIVDHIEQLQMVENQKVYEKSINILETYFELEQQDDIMNMISQSST